MTDNELTGRMDPIFKTIREQVEGLGEDQGRALCVAVVSTLLVQMPNQVVETIFHSVRRGLVLRMPKTGTNPCLGDIN